MAIAFVKSGKGTAAASTTITPAFGTATTSGNLIVLGFSSDNVVSGTGTGWTQSANMSQVGNNAGYTWWRISTGQTSFPVATLAGSANTSWVVAEFSGADSSPYDASQGQVTATGAVSYTTPNITPSTGNRVLVANILGSAAGNDLSGAYTSWLNSFTAIDNNGQVGIAGDETCAGMAYRLVVGNGVTTFSSGATFPASCSGRVGEIISFNEAAASTFIPGGTFSDLTAWNAPVLIRPIKAVPYR